MNVLQQLEKEKVIAIMRRIELNPAIQAGQALVDGGIRFMEVTMNTANALRIIDEWRSRFPADVQVGAGTVMNRQMVKDAVSAGASYIITPHLDQEVIEEALQNQIEVWPGVLTPSEIAQALKWGAHGVKIFPIHHFGPRYLKDLRGPFDKLKAIAVGGVTAENMRDYLKAGAVAVAFGSSLFQPEWIAQGRWNLITQQAHKLTSLANME